MSRCVLILGLFAVALFAFDVWSLWYMDANPDARAFFASRTFTVALIIGGTIAASVTTVIVSALILYPAAPAGRMDPEDHV